MTKRATTYVFEAASYPQIEAVLRAADLRGLSPDEFNRDLIALTGIPLVEFLSQQEADHLIRRWRRNDKVVRMRPFGSRPETDVPDGKTRPTAKQMTLVRRTLGELMIDAGKSCLPWKRERVLEFIRARTGTADVTRLNRAGATKVVGALMEVKKRRN